MKGISIKHRRRLVSSHIPSLSLFTGAGLLTVDQGKWREIHPLTYSSLYFEGNSKTHSSPKESGLYGLSSFRGAIFVGRGYSQVLPNSSSRLARKAKLLSTKLMFEGTPFPGLPRELSSWRTMPQGPTLRSSRHGHRAGNAEPGNCKNVCEKVELKERSSNGRNSMNYGHGVHPEQPTGRRGQTSRGDDAPQAHHARCPPDGCLLTAMSLFSF